MGVSATCRYGIWRPPSASRPNADRRVLGSADFSGSFQERGLTNVPAHGQSGEPTPRDSRQDAQSWRSDLPITMGCFRFANG
jgi:hypothetical protein